MRPAPPATARGSRGLSRAGEAAIVSAVVSGVAAHNLWLGWERWGDLLVDTGRELEVARRLLAGETLYTQLRFIYPPLAPWVNALLYRLFGVHLDVLATAGVVSGILAGLVCYLIARRFIGVLGSLLVAVTFFYACAFSHITAVGIFNWVLPYSFSATYGMLTALASLLFLIRFIDENRSRHLVTAVALLAVTSFAKLEPLLPVVLAHGVWLGGAAWARKLDRGHLAIYLAASLAVLTAYAAMTWHVGWVALWSDNLGAMVNPGSSYFIRVVMGLVDLPDSLKKIAFSVAVLGIAPALALGGALAGRWYRDARLLWPLAAASGIIAGVIGYIAPVDVPFRALPFFTLAVVVVFVVRLSRDPTGRAETLRHLVLWTFAFAAAARVPFAADTTHYGFFLLPGSIVGLGVALFAYLPKWLGGNVWGQRSATCAGVGLLAGLVLSLALTSATAFALRVHEVSSPRGRMYVMKEDRVLIDFLRLLSSYPKGTRLLPLPRGATLVFLSGLEPGDGLFCHLPMDYFGRFDDASMVARWSARPPDLVLLIEQPMPEFGYQGFGIDYAQQSLAWLQANYVPVTDPAAKVVLLHHMEKTGRR